MVDHFAPSRIIKSRWTKDEIDRRQEYRCEHKHSGITHPNCYNKENGIVERKGCLDIETGNLKADFSTMLSFTIKTSGKDEYIYDHITLEAIEEGRFDADLVETLIDTMWKYDRLIVHYGKNGYFDIPYARARYLWLSVRRLYKGLRFPGYGEMYVTDTYTMAKQLLTISSRRQNSIANVVLGEDIKTPIDRDYWMAISNGSHKQRKEALAYIVDHNIRDCEQLDGNYLTLLSFIDEKKTSI
jgi:hypothetical protein